MDLIDSREIWISAFQELDQFNPMYWSNLCDYAEIILQERPDKIDELRNMVRALRLYCWQGKRDINGYPLIPSVLQISQKVQNMKPHSYFKVRIDTFREERSNQMVLSKLDDIKKFIIRSISEMNIRYKNPKMKMFG